jgi:sodium transport system ATP-binding protein
MIEAQHLRKTFRDLRRGQFVAVQDLSFTVKPGEIFGLLGPNGAGKTTTMRLLCTVLKPSSGTARVAGYDLVTQPADVRRQIGFLSANTGIYDRMSAWEFVEYFGRLYSVPEDRLKERLEQVFRQLNMNDFRDVLGGKMSTGMKQRVSIARTIVHDPPVLVFDEPTSGLDVLVARNVLQAIKEFRNQGKCVIFSTHVMREVEQLCDRVAIVHRGRVLAMGTLPALREEYREDDVEELFFRLIHKVEEEDRENAEFLV